MNVYEHSRVHRTPKSIASTLIRGLTTLAHRDFVTYRRTIGEAGLAPEAAALLESLAEFHGSWQKAIDCYRHLDSPRIQGALDDLRCLLELLEAHGVKSQVSLDLALARDFGYYTGLVFVGYAPGVGLRLCGGGRPGVPRPRVQGLSTSKDGLCMQSQ